MITRVGQSTPAGHGGDGMADLVFHSVLGLSGEGADRVPETHHYLDRDEAARAMSDPRPAFQPQVMYSWTRRAGDVVRVERPTEGYTSMFAVTRP
jgi:hypothetical protein